MFLDTSFCHNPLPHHNRQVRQEHPHHTVGIAQMEHLILIHFPIIVTVQFFIELVIDLIQIFISFPIQHIIFLPLFVLLRFILQLFLQFCYLLFCFFQLFFTSPRSIHSLGKTFNLLLLRLNVSFGFRKVLLDGIQLMVNA